MAERIQRRRTKGWVMPPGALYVGRPTLWGNPFVVGSDSGVFQNHDEIMLPAITLETSLRLYRDLVSGFVSPEMYPHGHDWMMRFKQRGGRGHPLEVARGVLRGHDLACWCPLDQPCHADVLLELANG